MDERAINRQGVREFLTAHHRNSKSFVWIKGARTPTPLATCGSYGRLLFESSREYRRLWSARAAFTTGS
jgi:hypothetical protein